jgi:hypothetical protein
MKELHDERLDIPVLSVCSVVCVVQMIVVIRKESMVIALDPMRLDFILTEYLRYKKQRGDFSMPSLWEKATINDPEVFWAIVGDFSPILANFAERLLNTPLNAHSPFSSYNILLYEIDSPLLSSITSASSL